MSTSLALHGGTPVRDVKTNPWPRWPLVSTREWTEKLEPALRAVYESGTEGVGGTRAAAFARDFAAFCQTPFCRLLPHGTDAIAAALMATLELDNWGPSGEVIIPNYTFIATASAPLQHRLSVAFVDIDPQTFTLSPEAVEQAVIPGKTRAILPVHLAGHPADMDRLNAIAQRHGLKVIEDCAQAAGAQYRGQPVGSLGDAGAFSFQASKNLCSGEGGAVVTNNPDVDHYVHAIMNAGRAPAGARWEYPRVGWNLRPSEYLAALLSIRLELLESQTQHRNRMAALLTRHLARIPGVQPPHLSPNCTRHGYHLYAILLDPRHFGNHPRAHIVACLKAEGVPCTAGYSTPLSDQPGLRNLAQRHPDALRVLPCPNTVDVCARSVWIFQEALLAEEADMQQIIAAFGKVQEHLATSR